MMRCDDEEVFESKAYTTRLIDWGEKRGKKNSQEAEKYLNASPCLGKSSLMEHSRYVGCHCLANGVAAASSSNATSFANLERPRPSQIHALMTALVRGVGDYYWDVQAMASTPWEAIRAGCHGSSVSQSHARVTTGVYKH